jgi:hypothetical protein
MARQLATANSIWISHGLAIHLSETFKLSRDTQPCTS